MELNFFFAAAVGTVLGFLAGCGIGGGSLLMLWLTLVVKMPAWQARCVNLMFFLPCALCATGFRLKQGALPIKKLLLPMALGCAAAAGCSVIGAWLDTIWLNKLFGGLLLFTGVKELLYREK